MTDASRSIMHEVMEQQTVTIAKAGIIATLNARTSVLASANPVESRYNPALSVVENIQLPPTLLSRFDLIYLILDTVNQTQDRALAKHVSWSCWARTHARLASRAPADAPLSFPAAPPLPRSSCLFFSGPRTAPRSRRPRCPSRGAR